ncbi:uncharacterized protein KGF55_002774 [Candida pseudojiufengensis]|uniref:uncharacterized protein n=1 Tax=Candida pseudojiufengensis TaxID=497109 RepID=UPI002223FAD5|nr:uncharacterized protein KGF55_002774 [Candida pseudojiufengensis]KAI5962982.1 hypothetical protein KGF55_002774 [Candida pseudojiufengensis]
MSLVDPELSKIEILDSILKELLEEKPLNDVINHLSVQNVSKVEFKTNVDNEKDSMKLSDQPLITINHNKALLLFALFPNQSMKSIDLVFNSVINNDDLSFVSCDNCELLSNIVLVPKEGRHRLGDIEQLISDLIPKTRSTDVKYSNLAASNDQSIELDSFNVDIVNWYCDCQDYQSKINKKSRYLDKSREEFELFNHNNRKNVLWRLIYDSKCNQLIPVPYCCHLLCIMIIVYNPIMYRKYISLSS